MLYQKTLGCEKDADRKNRALFSLDSMNTTGGSAIA